jgi:cytoskeleton protein RodZ
MSENTNPSAVAVPSSEAPQGAQAAGAMLRQAREDAGLHVAALAAALKVTVKKLEALEAGRIDLLPDATFARGLAASICRGLKLDPKPVLDLMPGIGGSRLGAKEPAINEKFEPSTPPFATTWRLPRPALAVVAVLLLGALVIYFYPQLPTSGPPEASQADVAEGPAELPSAVPAESPIVQPEPSTVAPAPVAPPAPEVVATPVAPASDAPVVFTAKTESWVQVIDAKGAAVLRRVLQAGERVPVTGALPLSVVVGRSDAVDVQVHGQPLALSSIAKNNVARFEVK